jgi:aspartyl-tRNA(Asn)/glutamyl-tRNA(Gln) amidotransferase subunit C
MAVSRDEVLHIARLARLGLSDCEVGRLAGELSAILEHFATLASLDTEGVEPTAFPLPLVNVMRSDEVAPSLPRSEVLRNAPAEEHGLFRVRAVLE